MAVEEGGDRVFNMKIILTIWGGARIKNSIKSVSLFSFAFIFLKII